MPGNDRSGGPYGRPAWSDRFAQPSVRQLRDELPVPNRRLFDAIRKHMLDQEGVQEALVWYGAGWHWAIEFRTRLSKDPLAVLIPAPHDLQLALPMDKDFTESLSLKRMKRAIRDGLELAREPFHTRWGIWSLAGSNLLDDLQDLIELKLGHLRKRAG
jgi:hypothetical protein